MFLILDIWDFIVFGHCERIVDDLEVCLTVGVDVDELFSSEVVILALGADRSLDLPCLGSWVLDGYLLRDFPPHHAIKLQLLDGLLRLRDALTHKVDIERICALDGAFDLESDVVVGYVGVKSNSEVKILMGKEVTFFGLDGEVFAAERSVPLELGPNVSEVGKLDSFADFGVHYNCSEAYSVLHEFHLYAVSCSVNVQQLLPLLVLEYLIAQIRLKRIDPGRRLETNLHLCLLSRVDGDGVIRDDLYKLFFEFL